MIPELQLAFLVVPAELVHLLIAERRIGVRQIRAGIDPREAPCPPAYIGWWWLGLACVVHGYPLILLGSGETRFFALVMMFCSVVGFDLRRRCGMRWALVIMTFEGALRMGVIIQMFVLNAWYGSPYPPGLPRVWGA